MIMNLLLSGSKILFSQCPGTCVADDLSDLTATAINQSLIRGSGAGLLDLGSTSFGWASLYLKITATGTIEPQKLMLLNGNPFLHNTGGGFSTFESLYLGENAGANANSDAAVNNSCVGVGYLALNNLGTGYDPILENDLGVGNHNTAVGWNSLKNANGINAKPADKNTLVGSRGGQSISTGNENTGVGWNIFYKNSEGGVVTGDGNTGIGANFILGKLIDGNYNTAVGHGALTGLISGSYNTVIGQGSGVNLTEEDHCLFLGDGTDKFSTDDYQLNIGNAIFGDLDNGKISIGNNNTFPESLFNVGEDDEFQINTSGKVVKYNNEETHASSNGIPAEIGVIDLSNQGDVIQFADLIDAGSVTGGLYRISYEGLVTTAATNSSALSIEVRYTDPDYATTTVKLPKTKINNITQTTSNVAGESSFTGTFFIKATTSTDIEYKINYGSNPGTGMTGSMKYSIRIVAEKM